MTRLHRLVLLTLSIVPLACGFSSGLPSNKTASELSGSEKEQYCEALGSFYERELGDRFTDYSCQLSGLFAGQLSDAMNPGTGRKACEDAAKNCREKRDDEPSDIEKGCIAPGCNATVGELERCHEAQVKKFARNIETLTPSCDPSTWGEFGSGDFDDSPPEECRKLGAACH